MKTAKIFRHLFYLFKLLRPRQWMKNLALFAAIVFGGSLFNIDALSRVILAFISFCLLASSTYIINDLVDATKDKLHPFKKARPIPSGEVGTQEAIFIFALMIASAFFFANLVGGAFIFFCFLYLGIQFLYSFIFKSIEIFDIFFIAAGYILRVLAGETLVDYHLSVWLLLTTISLSLFLAIGKRRAELTLLKNYTGARVVEIRQSLSHYSEPLLDVYTVMFATATAIFYSLFTFLENPGGIRLNLDILMPDFLPGFLHRKWLMITIFPVLYGIMRYLQDIYEKQEGESPERVLLSDRPLLASLIVWGLLVIFIIYFIV